MDPQHIGSRRLESYRSYRSLKKRDFANSVNSDIAMIPETSKLTPTCYQPGMAKLVASRGRHHGRYMP